MGADKATLAFRGRPLVVHALKILTGAGLSVSIAGSRADLRAYAPVVEDAGPGLGPLGGICPALASTVARWAVFLPVDLPLLPAALVRFLLKHARMSGCAITLTSVAGFVQTFPAVLDRAVLPGLEAELEAGRRGCFSAFQAAANGLGQTVNVVSAELLAEGGQVTHPEGLPAASWFSNINSAEDLRRAEEHFPGFIA
jgi:molybdopterin-guanine dinucleotide biosynthesis protein A